jgi:TonB dependent receptor-like, beta-barrel/Carboxypeptidase regulatory-like domain
MARAAERPRTTMRRFTTAAIGGLVLLIVPVLAVAQNPPSAPTFGPPAASAASGALHGVVRDQHGTPVPGVMVSALGAVTAFAVTGPDGQFELAALPPGPYLVQAHARGYTAPRGRLLEIQAGARVASAIALDRLPGTGDTSVLAADLGSGGSDAGAIEIVQTVLQPKGAGTDDGTAAAPEEDELTWRLRHLRRSILKEVPVSVAVVADGSSGDGSRDHGPVSTPIRMAADLIAAPLSGQVNLLTTSTFDDPAQLFQGESRARGITYIALGAPAGDHADWTMRAALTQGDLTSWIVAGDYRTRADAPGRHRYDVRLSYSTQRYDGGNPEALRAVTDGSRNAGMVSANDIYRASDRLSISYGGRYSHYDYLDGRTLVSPHVRLAFVPADRFRVTALLSRRAVAPGAEEFVPPSEGIWLPPQRTFSSVDPGGSFAAEQATHLDVGVERDTAAGTITAHAFRQHVDNQLVTLFGAELPDRPVADIGHYFVGGAGNVDVVGWSAGFRARVADRVTGSVEYSVTRAAWEPGADADYLVLLAPSVVRQGGDAIHDVSTRIQAALPETETHVLVLYRLSDGFSRADAGGRPSLDSRFDVQVEQALPFMDFSTAKWQMLIGVRDLFREPAAGQSIYDELLVVRPPKQIVGGLTLHF